jgi:hypothetical protein
MIVRRGEIRTGVTFAFGVTKGPDILSRLSASELRGLIDRGG